MADPLSINLSPTDLSSAQSTPGGPSCLSDMSLRKKICWVLAIFGIITVLLVTFGLLPFFSAALGLLATFGLLPYIYKRLIKPFTTPVIIQIGGAADLESQHNEPNESFDDATAPVVTLDRGICGPWSTNERVATLLFVIFVIALIIPPMLEGMIDGQSVARTGTEEPLFYSIVGYNLLGSLLILLVVLTLIDIADILGHAIRFNLRRLSRGDNASSNSSHVELVESSHATSSHRKVSPTDDLAENGSFWNVFALTSSSNGLKIKALVIFVIYALITAISLGLSYSAPAVIRMDIFVEKLPECVDGFTMTLVSDVHIGPLVGRTELIELIDLVNGLDSDIITLVGDIADGTPSALEKFVEPIKDLSASDGVFVVPGNHEYLHGSTGPEWMQTYAEMGLTPLMNTRETIGASADCAGFELLGVDDFEGTPSFADAVAGMDGDMVGVVLAHQPNQATHAMAVTEGSIDVMLSGHTHGGQTWPLHLISWSTNDNFAGLNKFEGMMAYVSLGAFGWGPRTRFGSSNNIDVITLRSGAAPEDPSVNYTIVWAYFAFLFAVVSFFFCCVCYPLRAFATRQKRQ